MVAYLHTMVKSPLKNYQQQLAARTIEPDAQQRHAIEKLDEVFHALSDNAKKTFFKRFKKNTSVKGLYLWGGVGIGKTFLMNLFYDCAEFPKLRMHFFTFMLMIHKKLQQQQGQKNPLALIAQELAAQTRVICFDEFFVTNIADAMILGELFKALFAQGIVLIATSNVAPDALYKDGLQRERFLPAIEAIKTHTEVIHLSTQHDYRRYNHKPAAVYFFPLDQQTQTDMQTAFDYYNNSAQFDDEPITINTHTLPVIRKHSGILWCDFNELCVRERSQNDYIWLAKHYHTILIDHVTSISAKNRSTILRFVHMIDIFYDEHVRVVIAAATPAHELYPKGPHSFEFQRTLSRLIEMQSQTYYDQDDNCLT